MSVNVQPEIEPTKEMTGNALRVAGKLTMKVATDVLVNPPTAIIELPPPYSNWQYLWQLTSSAAGWILLNADGKEDPVGTTSN